MEFESVFSSGNMENCRCSYLVPLSHHDMVLRVEIGMHTDEQTDELHGYILTNVIIR